MEKNLEYYREQCQEIANMIANEVTDAKSVKIDCGGFCPYLCFIRIDALDKKDYPHNISDNSIFIDIKIDFQENKFELFRGGHIWLSPKDKKTPQFKCLAMRGMFDIAEEKGVKKMRKTKHKDNKTTANKIALYFNEVMKAVKEYTGGYPYRQGIEE